MGGVVLVTVDRGDKGKWAVFWLDAEGVKGVKGEHFKTKKEALAFALRLCSEVPNSVYVSPAYFWRQAEIVRVD